jgi:hypothetical protein
MMFSVASGNVPRQRHAQHRAVLALAALILAACSSGPPSAAPPESTPGAAAPSSLASTVPSTPTAPPALVGNWLGVHNCQRIIDIMSSAGMPEQGLLNVADSGTLPGVTKVDDIDDPENPCVGAVDVPHSHFFTASGMFGSRDANGEQVDDGRWEIVDTDTFEINGTPFDFQVAGDELRMEAVDVGTCPSADQWCPEAWKLMVAMPGMAWTRSAD